MTRAHGRAQFLMILTVATMTAGGCQSSPESRFHASRGVSDPKVVPPAVVNLAPEETEPSPMGQHSMSSGPIAENASARDPQARLQFPKKRHFQADVVEGANTDRSSEDSIVPGVRQELVRQDEEPAHREIRPVEFSPELEEIADSDHRAGPMIADTRFETTSNRSDSRSSSSQSSPLGEPVPEVVPIDLASALQLTAGQNPQVAFAQERIQEAFAQLDSAEVLWVPSLRAGFNYNKHEGRIQDVEGRMIETSRGSIYHGMGAMAVGAGSPAVPGLWMNFHLRDAIFQPKIAERRLGARQQASRAVTNDMLLETSLAYLDLLEAMQVQAVAEETLDHARRLAELTESFARTGQGLRADADRADAELSVREVELRRAQEQVRVASVRLTQVLSHDQTVPLMPLEPALIPVELVSLDSALPELISTGLSHRPELAEAQFLVGEAVQRLRREKYAPLVPSVLLGMSYGGNAGGLGSSLVNHGDRFDLDVAAFWEVRNLGFGERAARDEARSRLNQERWRQVRMMDQVARDVAEAHAQTLARREQIAFAEAGIQSAQESYRRNLARIQDGQGLPIEALQSIQALDAARRQYVQAVADYNRAQFQLHRALGWPILDNH